MEGGVVKSGWLTKRGEIRTNWKRRYFVLEASGFLKYYGSDLDTAVASAKNVIDMRNVSVITTGSNLNEWPHDAAPDRRIALVTKKRVFYFYSEAVSECRDWVAALNKTAAEICNVCTVQ